MIHKLLLFDGCNGQEIKILIQILKKHEGTFLLACFDYFEAEILERNETTMLM